MDASGPPAIKEDGLQAEQKPPRSWNERVSQVLNLIAISWLGIMLWELAILYHYAWQEGLYPKPDAPSYSTCGAWCYDLFLEVGVRELLSPPVYAFIFALLALIFRLSWRNGITLIFSIVFTFIAFWQGFLVAD